MTVPTGTTQTYQQIGIREDLSDVIYNISPTETPVMTMIGRGKATQTNHEWQTDALSAAATNRAIEGDDASYVTMVPTVRINDYTQIFTKAIVLSGTSDSVNTAGRKSELSYQLAKRSKEMKRDMEYAITRNQASSAGGAGTARSLASMESWIVTNRTSLGTGTAQTTFGWSANAVAAPTDSSVAATITEAALKAVIAACWTSGAEPSKIVVGQYNKRKISAFAGIATQTVQYGAGVKSQGTILGAADVYVSDFGVLNVVADRFSRDQTALILDPDYWSLDYLRPFQQFPLAKTGDAEKRMMLAECTLKSSQEAASGKIADLATS